MRIIVSFDTEDFTDPASNDVLLRLCQTLSERGVTACFGLVGEEARFIRDQGREDLIAALAAHEIGYHTDNHFLFPDERHPMRFGRWIAGSRGSRGLAPAPRPRRGLFRPSRGASEGHQRTRDPW